MTSHSEQRIRQQDGASTEALILADAFSESISASSRLEAFYGDLQLQVTYLGQELAERNAELNASLAANERMHRSLRQIVDSLPCGVLVVEVDGSISMINPEGIRLLDLGNATAMCLKTVSQQTGIDLTSFLGRHQVEEEEQEFYGDYAGARRWLAVRSRNLFHQDACGTSRTATILTVRDNTIHKQLEAEREMARKATALSEVATTLAHEIRNPLASLELFAGLISEGDAETSKWIAHLRAGIRSLSGTVNNVLSFHGLSFPAFTPLNLAEAIHSSVEFVRPIALQAGVELSFYTNDYQIRLKSNMSALQQLVLNMVSNAIRHTPKGGKISVKVLRVPSLRSSYEPERAVIAFSDTGCGIDPVHLKEIFRAGFSGSGNSSGLGLAVCMQIVRQHDGDIRVSSSPDAGTTFMVEMPIQ